MNESHEKSLSIAALFTRLALGSFFVDSGLGKLQQSDLFAFWLSDLGLRGVSVLVYSISLFELALGFFILLGLFGRVTAGAAVAWSLLMLALLQSGDLAQVIAISGRALAVDVEYFVLLVFSLWIFAAGPGKVSLDHLYEVWRREKT